MRAVNSTDPLRAATLAAAARTGAAVGDYIEILKPRVMSLVVFTGLVGLVVAPGHLHPVLAAVAVLCIAVGAGASGAINMWYDRDIDAVMRRTAGRPLPSGRMMPGEALGFGCVLAVGAVLTMGLAVNLVAAGLLALTIGFYVFVYTMWLKRRTPQNIVIGGAAGALPPLIGWAAVTGEIGWGASRAVRDHLFLDAAAFLGACRSTGPTTTPRPAYRCCRSSPARARPSGRCCSTRLVLWPVTAAPWLLGVAGPVYGVPALLPERDVHRLGGAGLARRGRAQRAADVRASRCSICS